MNITGGKFNGRKINTPDEKLVRPTLSKVRMSVFNTLYSAIGEFEGKSFLDMFGGSGIMGLEALSRGFDKVVVFEKNRGVSEVIKSNYKLLGLTPCLYLGDALKLAQRQTEKFDVIYVDPPYMSGVYTNVLEWVKSSDFSGSVLVLEHVIELDLDGFDVFRQKKYGDKFLSFIRL